MVDNLEIKKYIYDNISKSDYNHNNIINYIKVLFRFYIVKTLNNEYTE